MSRIQKTVTKLNDLEKKEDFKEEIKIDESNEFELQKASKDLSLSLEKRLYYLEKYYSSYPDNIGETINSITGMYMFAQTKILTEYLNSLSCFLAIPIDYRIECAKCLNNGEGYPHINNMFKNEMKMIKTLPTPVRVDTILFLMDSKDYRNESREYFCDVINDMRLENLYRFRVIQSLENKYGKEKDKEIFIFYAKEASIRFMNNNRNNFTYRVLACQYLLEKCDPDENLKDVIEKFLLEVGENPTIDEDVRADACDVILQYGGDSAREGARALLFIIGGGNMSRNNIYKNSQNVHIRSIEDSVQKIIEKLSCYHPKSGKIYDFSKTREDIIKKIEQTENKEEKTGIEEAMTRILIDRAVYGSTNLTLGGILAKIWTYIQDSEFREELEKRLFEELLESNNKCSSGYASRLVNTLSGFDEAMSISISFEDQIVANLEGRLNHRIKELKDEEYMSLVLEEMTLPVIFFEQRRNFLKFFREHISSIREEMYNEFKDFMEDIDYDFYFRKAIIHYEGCN